MSGPGQTFVVSLFVDPILAETGWTRTAVSRLYSAASIGALLGAIFFGWAFDRFGARVSLTGVSAVFGVSVFMMGQVSSPLHLFLGFLAIRNFGQTALCLISSSMVSMWFIRLRGRATAFTMLAFPASQVTLAPLVMFSITTQGWRITWEILGVAVLAIMVLPAILLVRRSPESIGLLPDGDLKPNHDTTKHSNQEISWTISEAIKSRSFWFLFLATAPPALVGTGLTFHHISLMKNYSIEPSLAAGILSIMAIAGLITTVITGYLVDKFPGRFVLVGGHIFFILGMTCLLFITDAWQGVIYGGLFGIGQGLIQTTNTVIWPNYFGRAHLGRIRGTATMGAVIAGGLGPWPFSELLSITGSYKITILSFLVFPVICIISALVATPPIKNFSNGKLPKTS